MSDVLIDLDSGGTFTDATVSTQDRTAAVKVLTTPHDLTVCFRDALDAAAGELGASPDELIARTRVIRFSTTVGTNAVIQRTGPRIGLLLARDNAEALDAPAAAEALVPALLAPREERVALVDPLSGDGDPEALLQAVERLLAAGVQRIVLVADGPGGAAQTERRMRRAIFARYPRHILGAVPVLLSTDVAGGEDDAARRLPTAVLNAYLHPSLEQFLCEAEDILRDRGYPRPLLVFGNDGTSNRVAKVTALRTYHSGPAGGVHGAARLCRHYELAHAACIDVGGTSTDLSFISGGEPERDDRGEVAGSVISLAMHRITALGGGGGTIAHLAEGELRLGPHSAGAVPGPACYGFGAVEPTVTDADLVLGVYDEGTPLAGGVRLDRARAERAIGERLATPLAITPVAAALRVRGLLEDRIADAIRAGAAQRGIDPAQLVLIAFGGAGPAHAAGVAERLGVSRVLVPAVSSVLSAFGIGTSDVEHRYAGPRGDELEHRALIDMAGEGFDPGEVELRWDEHGLRAIGRLPHPELTRHPPADEGAPAPAASRAVTFTGEPCETPVYDAGALAPGDRVRGPALVISDVLTLPVPPGWTLRRDSFDQWFLEREA